MIKQYQNKLNLSQSAAYALMASCVALVMGFVAFFAIEPVISQAVDSTAFYVQATITSENSFLVQPPDTTMVGSLSGLTGGQATGTTQFVVKSNNAAGYAVTIAFENNAGAEAMYGDLDGSEAIRDYDPTDGAVGVIEPSYEYTASSAAQFAYTVVSSTTADTDLSFQHNGSNACNTAGTDADGTCWKAPTVAGFQIISTSDSAPTGATSTITFNITVPNAPAPAPDSQTYTATATLSLLAN